MGFRFRKSIKAGPIRINVSKSGVGYSVGGKGYRYTKKANGRSSVTTSIPGTGISYTKETGGKKNSQTTKTSTHTKTTASASAKTTTKKTPWQNIAGLILLIVGFAFFDSNLLIALFSFIASIVFLCIGMKKSKKAGKFNQTKSSIQPVQQTVANGKKNTTAPSAIKESNDSNIDDFIRSLNETIDDLYETTPATLSPQIVSNSDTIGYTAKTYKATGMSHYTEAIMHLAVENSDYDMSKKEIVDESMTDQKIWKYEFYPSKVELVPEPENPHDPNAIKVIVDGQHVAYIKKGSCSHLLNVIKANRIRGIDCTMGGGPYKVVYEDYDFEKGRDTYKLERDSIDFFVHLTVYESNN